MAQKQEFKLTNRDIQDALEVLNGPKVLIGGEVVRVPGVLDWPFGPLAAFRLAENARLMNGTNDAYNAGLRAARRDHMEEVEEKGEKVRRFKSTEHQDHYNEAVERLNAVEVDLQLHPIAASDLLDAYKLQLKKEDSLVERSEDEDGEVEEEVPDVLPPRVVMGLMPILEMDLEESGQKRKKTRKGS